MTSPEIETILSAPLTDDEAAVLEALRSAYERDPDFCFRTFDAIADDTSLPRERAADAARALRQRGVARLGVGLRDADGALWGSGYAITEVGRLIAEARRARAEVA